MTVNLPHPKTMPNCSILLLGISYPGLVEDKDKTRGREMPKVFTYALLKAGGVWYTTGAGKTPQAAGWGAVERWLERDNRVLEFIEVVSGTDRVWTAPGEAVGNWHADNALARPTKDVMVRQPRDTERI